MVRLSRATNPVPLTESKVNYFFCYYEFVISQVGFFDNLILENHRSLISKIIFQLRSNRENCVEYLDAHFDNQLLHDGFLDLYPDWQALKLLISQFKGLKLKQKKEFVIQKTGLLAKFITLESELLRTGVERYLTDLISYLICEHDVQTHSQDIQQKTRLIVSEFFIQGYNKTELGKVFDKILSRDINKFPFPQKVRGKKAKHTFINRRSFRQQFEGIKNILDKPHRSQYIFFRLFNVSAKASFKFRYNRVTFWAKDHSFVKRLIELAKGDRTTEEFFVSGDFILAGVKVRVINYEIAKQDATNLVRSELNYLNLILDGVIYVDPFYTLTSTTINENRISSIGFYWNSKTQGVDIEKYAQEQLLDNPFRFLRKHKSEATDYFLQFEELYIQACTTDKVSDYWLYLETLLSNYGTEPKTVKVKVSKIILLNRDRLQKQRLHNYLTNVFQDTGNFKIEGEGWNKYLADREGARNWSIGKLAKRINHPFTNDLVKEYELENVNYSEVYREYYSILLEAYGLRNSFIHSGLEHDASRIKIQTALPRMVMRFRWVIFEALRSNKGNESFDSLVKNLVAKADFLLKA